MASRACSKMKSVTFEQAESYYKHMRGCAAQNATNGIRFRRWLRLWKLGTDINLRIPGLIPEHDL